MISAGFLDAGFPETGLDFMAGIALLPPLGTREVGVSFARICFRQTDKASETSLGCCSGRRSRAQVASVFGTSIGDRRVTVLLLGTAAIGTSPKPGGDCT